jgi:hypothetical protein
MRSSQGSRPRRVKAETTLSVTPFFSSPTGAKRKSFRSEWSSENRAGSAMIKPASNWLAAGITQRLEWPRSRSAQAVTTAEFGASVPTIDWTAPISSSAPRPVHCTVDQHNEEAPRWPAGYPSTIATGAAGVRPRIKT